MHPERKQILVWIALIIVGIVFLYSVEFEIVWTGGNYNREDDLAALVVDFGDGHKRMFEGPVTEGMTVLQAVYTSAQTGGFPMKYWVDDKGQVNLGAINDEVNAHGHREWAFYLNGFLVPTRTIGKVMIKDGDLIEVKFR